MSNVGFLLSEFRKARRLTQLDLAVVADVSSRHVSFIERGRSKPSREMLLRLADVMALSLRESNLLLSSGGYAMAYSDDGLDGELMAGAQQAFGLLLEKHNPYPALVVDGNWRIRMANAAHDKIMKLVPGIQASDEKEPLNLMYLLFDTAGIRPLINNWDEVAGFLLRRLQRQSLVRSCPENQKLLADLLRMDPPDNWQQPSAQYGDAPVLTIHLSLAGCELCVFSTITQFGTALDVGLQELVLESYFPADEQTRRFFEGL